MLRKCFWKQLDLKSTYLTGQETHLSAQHNGSGWICLLVGETRSWGKGVWSGGPGPGRCKLRGWNSPVGHRTGRGFLSAGIPVIQQECHCPAPVTWMPDSGRSDGWMDGWMEYRKGERGPRWTRHAGTPSFLFSRPGAGPRHVHFNQFFPTLKITKIITD